MLQNENILNFVDDKIENIEHTTPNASKLRRFSISLMTNWEYWLNTQLQVSCSGENFSTFKEKWNSEKWGPPPRVSETQLVVKKKRDNHL